MLHQLTLHYKKICYIALGFIQVMEQLVHAQTYIQNKNGYSSSRVMGYVIRQRVRLGLELGSALDPSPTLWSGLSDYSSTHGMQSNANSASNIRRSKICTWKRKCPSLKIFQTEKHAQTAQQLIQIPYSGIFKSFWYCKLSHG